MNEDDFGEIVAEIRAQLEGVGLSDIGDEENYLTDGEDGRRRPSNKRLAIATLEAFGRHVALLDRDAYFRAMALIRDHARGEYRDGEVRILPIEPAGAEDVEVILVEHLFEMVPLMKELGALIERLSGDNDDDPDETWIDVNDNE